MPDLPTGTVTFLFTDIEGSTKLWEEHPDAMRQALDRHDALLRQAIENNSGVVFKTIGDAFCAAFATAPDALSAAVSAQCALHAEAWTEGLSLRVRMALHTGTAELRDEDYFGQPLNRVARLHATGYGGQVLLSDVTHGLTRDTLPPSAAFKPLGEHRLRDLGRPEPVFQLLHPDLPSEFLPLKSLDNPDLPNNMPVQVTSFIGREKEIETVKSLLGKAALLTLTGSGGCGKTRLGLQVAADVLENYPDGVWFVELAPLADPALVPQSVAQVLSVTEEPGKPLVQTLVAALKDRKMLLVLDNCEHVLDACARLIDTLIRACPNLKVLASSREGLGIAGELTYRIPSLSLPDLKQTSTVESVSQYEAVQLFVERALFHLPAFAVTNQNAPALASLCHRLDGIPFAIELAAARVRSLSVEEINSKLDNRFRLLTGGSRTALPRQQTLRALIDWSFDLLNAQEKTLLCRLSVFAGGWTLEAAETVGVGAEMEEWEALDLLTSLADKSLIVTEIEEQHTRYRLLETVRQYARDRLGESGEGGSVRLRHQAFFVALAEEAELQLRGPQGAMWLDRLDREHDNLRAALDGDNKEAALQVAGALYRFWYVRGYYTEGRNWLAHTLSLASAECAPARAKALNAGGVLAFCQGDSAVAQSLHEQGLALYQKLGDKEGLAVTFNNLGNVAFRQGDYAAAQGLYAQSLVLSQELGNKINTANAFGSLAYIAQEQGDYAVAHVLLTKSQALFRESGDKEGIATTLGNLGLLAYVQDDYVAAQGLNEQCLLLSHEVGNKVGIANSLNNLSNVSRERGDYTAAQEQNKQSLALHQEMGNQRGTIEVLESFAALALAQAQPERAAQMWGAAEAFREAIGSPLPPSERARYDRQVAQARAAAGEEVFAAAWEQGRAMSLEQAIQYALEEGVV